MPLKILLLLILHRRRKKTDYILRKGGKGLFNIEHCIDTIQRLKDRVGQFGKLCSGISLGFSPSYPGFRFGFSI